jgi:hypothetical protein
VTSPLFPSDKTPSLEQALLRFEEDPSEEAYRSLVFPHSAMRMWESRHSRPSADLLIVPVGTQPYSPLLACLGTVASKVAFLVTDGSRPCADDVQASLEGLFETETGDPPYFNRFFIEEGTSGEAVCRAVDSSLVWACDPWSSDVSIDISGGRKSTTATLGAIAGIRGFRQTYVQGELLFGGPYYHREQLLAIANIGGVLGNDLRICALALFKAGAFQEANRTFEALEGSILIGKNLGWLSELSQILSDDPELWADKCQRMAFSIPECSARGLLEAASPDLDPKEFATRFLESLEQDFA